MWFALWNKQMFSAKARRELFRQLGKSVDFRIEDYPEDRKVLVFPPGEYIYENVVSETCEHWVRTNSKWKLQEQD